MVKFKATFRAMRTKIQNNVDLILEGKSKVDARNLNLEALLYEKNHLENEIYLAREFKTPNLQNAFSEDKFL